MLQFGIYLLVLQLNVGILIAASEKPQSSLLIGDGFSLYISSKNKFILEKINLKVKVRKKSATIEVLENVNNHLFLQEKFQEVFKSTEDTISIYKNQQYCMMFEVDNRKLEKIEPHFIVIADRKKVLPKFVLHKYSVMLKKKVNKMKLDQKGNYCDQLDLFIKNNK